MSKRSRRRARLRYRREVERMLRPAALRYLPKRFIRSAEMLAKSINEMANQFAFVSQSAKRFGMVDMQFNFTGQFDKQREEKSDAG